jgi:hypothetical protein
MDIDKIATACKGLSQADVSAVVTDAYRRHLLFSSEKRLQSAELLAAADAARRRTAAAHTDT